MKRKIVLWPPELGPAGGITQLTVSGPLEAVTLATAASAVGAVQSARITSSMATGSAIPRDAVLRSARNLRVRCHKPRGPDSRKTCRATRRYRICLDVFNVRLPRSQARVAKHPTVPNDAPQGVRSARLGPLMRRRQDGLSEALQGSIHSHNAASSGFI